MNDPQWLLVKVVDENGPVDVGEVADALADAFTSARVHVHEVPSEEITHYVDYEDLDPSDPRLVTGHRSDRS